MLGKKGRKSISSRRTEASELSTLAGAGGSGTGAAANGGAGAGPLDDHPASRLTRPKQKYDMSCSLTTVQSAGRAFGKPMPSEDEMLKNTQVRKKGTYDVKRGGRGIPFPTVAHTEGMGAYGAIRDKGNFKKIEARGHIPIVITETGAPDSEGRRGRHVMAARSGSPLGSEYRGHMELLDTMRKSKDPKAFVPYEKALSGNPFNIGRMSHSAHSLYGITPTRARRSSSTESAVSTSDGLTPWPGDVNPNPKPSGRKREHAPSPSPRGYRGK